MNRNGETELYLATVVVVVVVVVFAAVVGVVVFAVVVVVVVGAVLETGASMGALTARCLYWSRM